MENLVGDNLPSAEKIAALLKKCIELEKTNYECTVALASTHAQKGTEENSNVDNERARALYQQFLNICPKDDKRIPRVREILNTQ